MTPDILKEWGSALFVLTGGLLVVGGFLVTGALLASAWIDFIRFLRRAPDASAASGLVALLLTPAYFGGVLWVIGLFWGGPAR